MAEDLTPIYRILDNQSETLGIAQKRIETLEAQMKFMRDEMAAELRKVLDDLGEDSDWMRLRWAQGVDHVAEHLGTDKGKRAIQSQGFTNLAEWWVTVQIKVLRTSVANWVLAIVLGAIGLWVVILLANSGALGKVLGVK